MFLIPFSTGVFKMAGKKGRSGRKPRDDGLELKAIALYVEHSGKTPITWFRFFKRIHGSRWQEKVRALMRAENEHAKNTRLWCCECQDPLLKWHIRGQAPYCHGCEMWQNKSLQRTHGKL